MQQIIEVTVSPQGDATVQTKGFVGSACLEASKFLERALGTVAIDRKTAEFHQSEGEQVLAQEHRPER